MGIDANNKTITLNHTHNKRVITDVRRLPHRFLIGNIVCYGLFQRVKKKGNDGDGNPLIYALKNLNGWSFGGGTKIALWQISQTVMRQILAKQPADVADVILYLPSSSALPHYIGGLYNRTLGKALVSKSVMRKKTTQEVSRQISGLVLVGKQQDAHSRLLDDLENSLPNTEYQMKLRPHIIRKYVDSFTVIDNPDDLVGLNVLLIDDIVSSGSSLRCAAEICMKLGANTVTGLCLMGPTT
ncbi:MAG: hypothetical protein ACNYPF_02170 [Candidatus Puniceispirillales bacterium WSBS_2018_MAG_OTU23]